MQNMTYLDKLNEITFFKLLNNIFKNPWFLLGIGILTFLSSVFSLEIYLYVFVSLICIVSMLLLKDTYVVLGITCYMYFSVSLKNNPSLYNDSIFYPSRYLYLIISLIIVDIISMIIRIFINIKYLKINKSRPKLLYGFIVLGISYLLGGLGYKEYTTNNILFSIVEILSLCLFYFLYYYSINFKNMDKSYIGYISLVGAITLILELIYVYINHSVIENGEIIRGRITFGWGMYNNMGGLMCIFIPGVMYLAYISKPKYSWIYILISGLFTISLYFIQSRTSLAVGSLIYIILLIIFIIKSNKINKLVSIGVLSIALVGFITLVIFKNEYLIKLIDSLINFKDDGGNGRMSIYKNGIENFFLKNPIFGTGFYSCNAFKWGNANSSFIPARWHNTYVQLLASCGLVGLSAYLFHRFETLKILFKDFNINKLILYFGVIGLIGTSILDCHFFNIGPGIIYGIILLIIERYYELKE